MEALLKLTFMVELVSTSMFMKICTDVRRIYLIYKDPKLDRSLFTYSSSSFNEFLPAYSYLTHSHLIGVLYLLLALGVEHRAYYIIDYKK